ncbi:GNAT family N-acetyltransferase [Streptomyces sp. NPDC002886]|uniref:GNAT family N-acetyltransferase n=1 Tax=Streptomyces sp. NPDC002886 TaxID=3364667 RepID=UPI0036BE1D66
MDAGVMGNGTRANTAVPVRVVAAAVEHGADWALRSAVAADVEVIAELRAVVMRPDLERLGRYDEHRVRQRLRDAFSPQHTSVVVIGREIAGCVAVRPDEGSLWLEHFYLAPHHQGRGLGSAVLGAVLERTDAQGMTVRLNVLQGSAARRLYERHGFVVETQDPVDVFMTRPPGSVPSPRTRARPATDTALKQARR